MAERIVDWGSAAAVAARLVPAGPAMTRHEVDDLVADLRLAAAAAQDPVMATSRLSAPAGGTTLVVDRPGWAGANAASFGALLDPVLEASPLARRDRMAVPGVARAAAAVEVGAVLAFVATKVLGQFDLLNPAGRRLLLVAPNIARVERQLGVDPHDFRLWVCLHEETHRVQFGANPWLGEWFVATVRGLVGDLVEDPESAVDRLVAALSHLPELLRSVTSRRPDMPGGAVPGPLQGGLLDLVQSPDQKAALERLTAVMSLLEGHADVIMDDVGPAVVPSVAEIRRRFARRRSTGAGPTDRLVRRVLGLEAKAAQYRSGAAFVRGVVDQVGLDAFNSVWDGPDQLPTPAEIADPALWVRRVHA